jgi:hypothetical protein
MDWFVRQGVHQQLSNSLVGRRNMKSECADSISLAFRSLSSPSFGNPSYGGFFSNKVILSRSGSGPTMIFIESMWLPSAPPNRVMTRKAPTREANSIVDQGNPTPLQIPTLPLRRTMETALKHKCAASKADGSSTTGFV